MKNHPRKNAKPDVKAFAAQRAQTLLNLAKTMWPKDETLARRYVKLARQIAMRHRIHFNARQYCKACGVPFVADTVKFRQERKTKTVLYACRHCSALRRIPYKGKPKAPPTPGLNRLPGSTKSKRNAFNQHPK